jgi:hypothetical protein
VNRPLHGLMPWRPNRKPACLVLASAVASAAPAMLSATPRMRQSCFRSRSQNRGIQTDKGTASALIKTDSQLQSWRETVRFRSERNRIHANSIKNNPIRVIFRTMGHFYLAANHISRYTLSTDRAQGLYLDLLPPRVHPYSKCLGQEKEDSDAPIYSCCYVNPVERS